MSDGLQLLICLIKCLTLDGLCDIINSQLDKNLACLYYLYKIGALTVKDCYYILCLV